jgi:hypothetical protein
MDSDHHGPPSYVRETVRFRRWEFAFADMMPEASPEGDLWILSPGGQALLEDGWEPFSVTVLSVYHPEEPDPQDLFRERVWFRRPIPL